MTNSYAFTNDEREYSNSLIEIIQNNYDDPKEIVWSRMGIFEPVEKILTHHSKLMNGQIDCKKKNITYMFEEGQTEKGVRLLTKKIKTGLEYKTSKFGKIKKNGVKVTLSHLQISPHALQRIHERSGYRRITSQDIWDKTDHEWTKELTRLSARDKMTKEYANLWLVPYGMGAFIVRPYESEDLGLCVIHTPKRKKDKIEIIDNDGYGLTAVTYIDEDDMFKKQREVLCCIKKKRYNDAISLIYP